MKPIKLSSRQLRGLISEAIQGRQLGEPEPFAVSEAFEDHFEKERNRIGSEWTERTSHVDRDDALHVAKRYLMQLQGVDETDDVKRDVEEFCEELKELMGV